MRLHESVRRRLQFRLRTLLIAMTLSAIPFPWIGWEFEQARREQAVAAWVRGMGGGINSENVQGVVLWDGYVPGWWRRRLDRWFGPAVRRVDLGGTAVRDLSRLAELENIVSLSASDTQVKDLSFLADLTNLEDVYLRDTHVTDLSPLTGLVNLRAQSLKDTRVSDFSPLASLAKLRSLYLYDTQVSEEQVRWLRQVLPDCDVHY